MEEITVPRQSAIKKFFRPLSVKILSVAVAVLLIAVTMLSCFLFQKNDSVVQANAVITETELLLESANSEIAELKQNIENEQQSSSSLMKKLEEVKKEKAKLEKQLEKLKKKQKKSGNEVSSKVTTTKKENKKQKKYPSISVPLANNGKKVCYLTFDDGPSNNTLKIIDILDKYGIKATFFVTLTGKTSYIKKIHQSGNAIGLHTASHNYSKIYSSKKAYYADLKKVSDEVLKQTGVESKIIRFPGGSSNSIGNKYSKNIMKKLMAGVEKKGYAYFDWNIDSGDASRARPTASYIMSNIKQSVNKQKNICILMHDTGPKSGTVEALPEMIEWLAAKGYRFEVLTTESPTFHHK